MVNRESIPGRQQLHVPLGVPGLLQHAVGLHPVLRHLRQLECRRRRLQDADRGPGVQEVEVGGPMRAGQVIRLYSTGLSRWKDGQSYAVALLSGVRRLFRVSGVVAFDYARGLH